MTMKILYGDDEYPIFQAHKRSFLRGYEVEHQTRPELVVESARANQGTYDLIITDYKYSYETDVMTGLDIISQIRQFDKKTPILLQSGEMNESLELRALETGANFALSKTDTIRFGNIIRELESKKMKGENR
jgi:CheY-like chemotaxis protein